MFKGAKSQVANAITKHSIAIPYSLIMIWFYSALGAGKALLVDSGSALLHLKFVLPHNSIVGNVISFP